MNLQKDLNFAIELAREAAALVADQYGKVRKLTKRNDEAVTDADRASQRLIVAALKKRFPEDGIIGEENESGDAITFEVKNPKGRNWVIDPIDGTNNFIAGLGAFAVCIGLLDGGNPVLGVVHDVTRNVTYAGAKGLGATLDSRPIYAIKTPLGNSSLLMLTSNVLDDKGHAPKFPMRWLSQTNWKIRMLGSAAIEAVEVAAGVAHGALTLNGKLWDAVAPVAIVLEAGGIVTDPSGKPCFPFDLKNYSGAKVPYLAAGPAAHAELVKEIAT